MSLLEINLLANFLRDYATGLNILIDAGLIGYVIYLKKEINKRITKDDLEQIQNNLIEQFKSEVKHIKDQNTISITAINQRIDDLKSTLLAELRSMRK